MIQSELGEIPKGWDICKVSDLKPKLETGKRPKGGVKGIESGLPSVGAESIKGVGYFDYSKTKYVSTDFASKMKRGVVTGYELLLYKDGGKPGTFLPHFGMYGEGFPFDEFVINEHVFLTTILTNCKENTYLTTLRDTLLPKLISGELEVSEFVAEKA